jgi:uncharacterized protein YjiS (DUF1127 family)
MSTLPRIDRQSRLARWIDRLLARRAERAARRALARDIRRLGRLSAHLLNDIGILDTTPSQPPQVPPALTGRTTA